MTATQDDMIAELQRANVDLQQRLDAALARRDSDYKERIAYQAAANDVLKVMSASPEDPQPVFDLISVRARDVCGAYGVTVCEFDGSLLHWRAATGISEDPAVREANKAAFPTPPTPDLAAGRAILNRATVHIRDHETEPGLRRFSLTVKSSVAVPLMRTGVPIGTLQMGSRERGGFSDIQVELLQTFADQAVIAIENARLFNETREALERQTATAEILKVIASSPSDVQPVFDAIAASANRLLGGFSSTVFRFIDGMAHLKAFTPTTPEADEILQLTFPRPVADFAPFQMTQAGEVMQIPDTEASTYELTEIARARGYRSMLFVPLMNKGVSIGFVAVTRAQPGTFADHHVQLLQTFADQAVIAIQNVRMFNEVQDRTRELSQSLEDLRTAQDRLVQTEKLASLGQLTAGIAHEIKNPLNFVNNFSALSAELTDELNDVLKPASLPGKMRAEVDGLTGMLRENLEKVVQHGKRADSIVKNMLLHSREGSGEHRPADINAILDESLNLAYHGARAEKAGFSVAFQRDLDPSVGMADIYPQEITRVLLNLISNGFYATTKRRAEVGDGFEPMLSAATKNLGDKVEIRIRDNGTGIPDDVKGKIFNPFFTTKPSGEGTGLGLSMSHDIIVKQHGGTIDVETELGNFTEFKIVLPRTNQR
jgi:signal transduction histidine kinase